MVSFADRKGLCEALAEVLSQKGGASLKEKKLFSYGEKKRNIQDAEN